MGSPHHGNQAGVHGPTNRAFDRCLPQKWRHRFATFADDVAVGANALEELFELLKATIECFDKAGIQVKASKWVFRRSRDQFSQLHDLRGTDSSQRRKSGPCAQLCHTTKRHECQGISGLHTANESLLPLLWHHSSSLARAHKRQNSVPKALAGRN